MNLKPETLKKIETVIPRYPERRSALLPVLHLVQEDQGYISKEAMEWIAEQVGVEPIHVYELVTFYPMLRETPAGKKQIRVCRTLSCALAGSYKVCEIFQKRLGAPLNGVSDDGEYSVEFVECLASCGTAPAVLVDDKLYENVTPERTENFIKEHVCPNARPQQPAAEAVEGGEN
ncbi:MAG: hypothetical protein Tsb0018_12360 [Opitutales bacterium]|tara:strand:+ start:567 stop:1091 length:525 start_codon:yes stop_codon:yes gene_type:complete